MTITEKEQELKPCKCGCGKLNCMDWGVGWRVKCTRCGTLSPTFATKAEAIAGWNNYVDPAPAPKWSDEPEEEGWYWVLIGQGRGMTLVNVFEEEDELYVHHMGNPAFMPVSDYETTFHVHGWQYIPFPAPPLPAEQEETP